VWLNQEPLARRWWAHRAAQPVAPDALAPLGLGQRLAWPDLYPAVVQGLPAEGAEVALADALAEAVRDHPARWRWLADVAEHPDADPLLRLRLASARLRVDPEDPDIPWLALGADQVGPEWPTWREELTAHPMAWSPAESRALSIWRLETGADPTRADLDRADWTIAVPPRTRPRAEAIASATVGISLSGRGVIGAEPPDLHPTLALHRQRGAQVCDAPDGTACLQWVLALAARTIPSADAPDQSPPPTPGSTPFRPLWEIAFDGDLRRIEAAESELIAWQTWLASPQRDAGRLLDRPRQRGRGTNPVDALRDGGGAPWTTAATLLWLDPQAIIGETDDGWVDLRVSNRHWQRGPCGGRRAPLTRDDGTLLPVTPRTPAEVMGRATLETAAAAMRRGERARALQEIGLAAAHDPRLAGAHAWVDAALPPTVDPSTNAGRLAGAVTGWTSPEPAPPLPRSHIDSVCGDP
jgi:hypothetical protein